MSFRAASGPIYFKYTQKFTTNRNAPTCGISSSTFACLLDLVAGALVATVDRRTVSAPIRRFANLHQGGSVSP